MKKNKEQAMRFNTDKAPISMVPSSLIKETAKVMGFGAAKYDRDNWKKGMPFTSVFDSLQRHLLAWNSGEDFDPESGLSHLAHASCNIAFLIEFTKTRPEFDDRHIETVESPFSSREYNSEWGPGSEGVA